MLFEDSTHISCSQWPLTPAPGICQSFSSGFYRHEHTGNRHSNRSKIFLKYFCKCGLFLFLAVKNDTVSLGLYVMYICNSLGYLCI